MEKIEKVRDQYISLYCGIIERMGKNKAIPTIELDDMVMQALEKSGLVFNGNSTADRLEKKLCIILGDDIEVVDNKREGERTRAKRLFCLKAYSDEDLIRLKKKVEKYFDNRMHYTRREATVVEDGKTKTKTTVYSGYRPRKEYVRKIVSTLSKFKESRKPLLDIDDMRAGMRTAKSIKLILVDWMNSLRKLEVDLEATITGGERGLIINKLDNTLSQLLKAVKVHYSEDKDLAKMLEDALNISGKVKMEPRIEKMPESFIEKKDSKDASEKVFKESEEEFNKAYLIFALGGILTTSGVGRVEIDSLIKCLREQFGIITDKKDVKEVLKDVKEIETSDFGYSYLLKPSNWESIKETYGPQNFHSHFIARIGMTKEEILEYLPDSKVELLSIISEREGIYKITYDRSMHTKKNLLRLYRTFRGEDMILDDMKLVNMLEREITIINGRIYRGDLRYGIECVKDIF